MFKYQEELNSIFKEAGFDPDVGIPYAWLGRHKKMEDAFKRTAHIAREEIFEFVMYTSNNMMKNGKISDDRLVIKAKKEGSKLEIFLPENEKMRESARIESRNFTLKKAMDWWDNNVDPKRSFQR